MVTDEPQYLDYGALRMVTQYINDLALNVANRAQRPVVDKPVPNPDGPCRQ
jgi:hypothetical protein